MLSTLYPSLAAYGWTKSSSRYAANKIHCIVKFFFLMNIFLNQKLSHVLFYLEVLYIKKTPLDAFVIVDMIVPVVNRHGSAIQYLFLALIHTTYFLKCFC